MDEAAGAAGEAAGAARTVVVGTAGHIDHGKTTLLRALTGIDADRLPEEQRRGMTIEVGYAHLALPDGREIDFVDVPGHDRLVGNMLVGAGEIDAALVVVAADDGPRAQTLEHLELLDALGIRDGLAVLTKVDAAESGRIEDVTAELAALLGRTSLAGSQVLAVSARDGTGLDELREALGRLAARIGREGTGPRTGSSRGVSPRLAVDRVFTVRGRGTVVTGTLRGGQLAAGVELRALPAGGEVRVRGIQVHGEGREVSPAGGRVALNVVGPAAESLARGAVLTADPAVMATTQLLVALRRPVGLEAEARWPLAAGSLLRLHLGTDAVEARVRRARREAASPEHPADVVRLVLERPVAAAAGDRFVLRRPAPGTTAAGGLVLDPSPPTGISRRRATSERIDALLAAVIADEESGPALLELHGWRDGRLAPDLHAAAERAARDAVAAHHAAEPSSAGLALAELRRAVAIALRRAATIPADAALSLAAASIAGQVAAGSLARDGDLVREATRSAGPPPELAAAMARLEAALSTATPPGLAEAARAAGCPAEGIALLERGGRLVRLEADLAWSFATYRDLAALALRLARSGPLTPAAFRDATGSSRKYALTILEDLDRRGLLRRTDEGHILGPRAPREPA